MTAIDEKLANLFEELTQDKKHIPKVKDLAPIFGHDAIYFQMKYNDVMNKPITLLPCGCIYYISVTEHETPLFSYMNLCPAHQLLETIRNSFIH